MSDEAQTSADGAEPMSQRSKIWWIVGGVVAVVVVGGAIAFALMPRDDASAGSTPSPSASSTTAAPEPSDSASPSPVATEPAATPEPSETTPPVDSNPFPELPAVEPEETGEAEGISAELVKFESVMGEVVGPGDVARPAVRVTVEITNTGDEDLNLNLVVMNAYMGVQRDPAETYEQPGGDPVNGSLAPGKKATGVYLFRIPEDRRDDVTFVVDYHAGEPAIVFRGEVP
jgi:hypothetical protein